MSDLIFSNLSKIGKRIYGSVVAYWGQYERPQVLLDLIEYLEGLGSEEAAASVVKFMKGTVPVTRQPGVYEAKKCEADAIEKLAQYRTRMAQNLEIRAIEDTSARPATPEQLQPLWDELRAKFGLRQEHFGA
jgi:hypothetical protein